MSITIMYQNPKTGDAHDITPIISAAKWTTKRSGTPASIELTAKHDASVVWDHGGILAVKDESSGLFYGYVVKISRTEKEQYTITAYDQTWYLKKNKETYVFTGKRADQIIAQIAADFELNVGALPNTGYVIPSMSEDAKTLFDTALKALDYTLINTGKMYCLWDDFGTLRLTNVADSKLDVVLGDESLATGYTYASEIDSETYNKIKLVKDNKTTGKRDVYVYQDSNNITLWGLLQDYQKADENMNAAQIKERAAQMLELYNRPKRTFDLKAISDVSVRAGRAVYVNIQQIGISAFYIVEEATHDFIKATMSLKLKVV